MGPYFQWFSFVPYRIPTVWHENVLLLLSHGLSLIGLVFSNGWPTTLLTLLYLRDCTPTCTFAETSKAPRTNRVEFDQRSPLAGLKTRDIICMIIYLIHHEVSSLPPGTTYLLPFGRLLRHPVIPLYHRTESNSRKLLHDL